MSKVDVDRHLARIPQPQRSTLEQLRKDILEVIPQAEQVISYGFPGFKVDGKVICGFDSFSKHCSFFPHSSLVIPAMESDLRNYRYSKGALRFGVDQPLPKSLVRKLIKTRLRLLRQAK
jgi:uncharacterized protein YdhG (YjbR/CyaY superfamily)